MTPQSKRSLFSSCIGPVESTVWDTNSVFPNTKSTSVWSQSTTIRTHNHKKIRPTLPSSNSLIAAPKTCKNKQHHEFRSNGAADYSTAAPQPLRFVVMGPAPWQNAADNAKFKRMQQVMQEIDWDGCEGLSELALDSQDPDNEANFPFYIPPISARLPYKKPAEKQVFQEVDWNECDGRGEDDGDFADSLPPACVPRIQYRVPAAKKGKLQSKVAVKLLLEEFFSKLLLPELSERRPKPSSTYVICHETDTSLNQNPEDWLNDARVLRDSHVRLVLRQLRHIERLNHALDNATYGCLASAQSNTTRSPKVSRKSL